MNAIGARDKELDRFIPLLAQASSIHFLDQMGIFFMNEVLFEFQRGSQLAGRYREVVRKNLELLHLLGVAHRVLVRSLDRLVDFLVYLKQRAFEVSNNNLGARLSMLFFSLFTTLTTDYFKHADARDNRR